MVTTQMVKVLAGLSLILNCQQALAGQKVLVQPDKSSFCSSGHCIDDVGPQDFSSLIHNVNYIVGSNTIIATNQGPDITFASVVTMMSNEPLIDPNHLTNQKLKQLSNSTIIGPCQALATYHGMFGGSKKPNREHFSATLRVGQGSAAYNVLATPITWGPYNVSADPNNDWVLTNLSPCAGLDPKIGWMERDNNFTVDMLKKHYVLAGHRFDTPDRGTKLWIAPSCKIRGTDPTGNWFLHDCPGQSGTSGSPIVYLDNNHIPHLVAMYTGSNSDVKGTISTYSDADANLALALATMHSQIDGYVDNGITGHINPVLAHANAMKQKMQMTQNNLPLSI